MSHEMDTSRPSSDHPDLLYSKGDMEAAIVQNDHDRDDELHLVYHSVTAEEFEQMLAVGLFGNQHVELIDGRLMDMPAPDPPHDAAVSALQQVLVESLHRRALVRCQMAFPAGPTSVPVPDITIVRWDEAFYRDRRPVPAETFAVVEVSNSTLQFDRDVKRRIYGAARIPEYWIVDVRNKRVHVHREPHDLGYGVEETRERDDIVSFAAFPDVALSVVDLVG